LSPGNSDHLGSSGISASFHASNPPTNARALKPCSFSVCATRALEASCGHVQYVTTSRSRGMSAICLSTSSAGKWIASGNFVSASAQARGFRLSIKKTRSPASSLSFTSSTLILISAMAITSHFLAENYRVSGTKMWLVSYGSDTCKAETRPFRKGDPQFVRTLPFRLVGVPKTKSRCSQPKSLAAQSRILMNYRSSS